jgi:hypothetical protein
LLRQDALSPIIEKVGLQSVFPAIGTLAQAALLPPPHMVLPEFSFLMGIVKLIVFRHMPSFF